MRNGGKNKPLRLVRDAGPQLRLHGTIARNLGLAIVSGRHAPGELLQNEIQASERLGVSRTAYREAVQILSAKGLVESRPKIGTRVSPPAAWNLLDPDVLSWLFEFDPDEKLLEDLFELRKMVEPQAAALAALRRSAAELEIMRTALTDMAQHKLSTEEGRRADRQFHSTLLLATRNAFLLSLTSGIAAAVHWTTVFKQREGVRRDPVPDHERVYSAIADGNAAAASTAMYRLLDLALLDAKAPNRPRRTRG